MALIPRVREFLYGPAPRPKTQMVSSERESYDYWGARSPGRDWKHLKEYGLIFRRGGPVSEAIRTYANLVFSNGFRIEGESEHTNQAVEDALEQIGLEIIGPQAIIDSLVYGDCFHELVTGQGDKGGTIVAQVPRNPETFRIDADEHGTISGYTQIIQKDLGNPLEIRLEPERTFHFSWENLGGALYGTSLIGSALNDIKWDAMISESAAQAIKRHGYPRFHIRVGKEGEDVEEELMRRIDAQFKNLNSKQEFVTTHDIEIMNIDQAGQSNVRLYGEWSTMRLCVALGIPEELLGLGRGSTEATANVKLRAFYDKISAIQKRFARAYTRQVIDQLTPSPGMCRLMFNEVNPADQGAIAAWLAQIMAATPMDPFAVVPRTCAQDMLGIEESDWDEEDFVEEPNEEDVEE